MNNQEEKVNEEEQKHLLDLYDIHVKCMDGFHSKDLKSNFENYMKLVEKSRIIDMEKDNDRLRNFIEKNKLGFFQMEKKYLKPITKTMNEYSKSKKSLILNLIKKIWLNEKISIEDIKGIPKFKLIYITILVRRKFNGVLSVHKNDLMVKELNNLDTKLKKRKEEILKFILKRFFKYIFSFEVYRNQKKSDMLKILFKKYFSGSLNFKHFKSYFSETKRAEFPILIIFNNELITKILSNRNLEEKFNNFIKNILVHDHKKKTNLKLIKMANSFRIYYNNNKILDAFKISVERMENQNYKLPWTVRQLELSIEFLNKLIKNIKKRN